MRNSKISQSSNSSGLKIGGSVDVYSSTNDEFTNVAFACGSSNGIVDGKKERKTKKKKCKDVNQSRSNCLSSDDEAEPWP